MINVLRYLLFIEYLNPQELQKLYKLKDKFVGDIKFNEINDFVLKNIKKATDKALKNKNTKKDELKASIKILGGIFNTQLINDTLDQICDKKLGAHEEIRHHDCASFMLEFNGKLRFKKGDKIIDFIDYKGDEITDILIDDGFSLDFNSFSISTTPWALQNINKLTNIKYEEFLKLSDEIKEKISTIKQNNLVDFYKDLINIIVEFIPINGDKLRIELNLYTKDKQNEPFLNSFFIQDIYKILKLYENNANDELLDKYLNTNENENKFNLRDEEKLFEVFEKYVNNMSISAFPSTYALMFSQQFAVNEILKRFHKQKGEFYSVNGPPGTGKTTLLKDIIAGVITQRAIEIAKLDFTDIFSSTKNGVYCLNPNLKGYEMIIASNNNGAVENVSKEIPEISSIDEKYLDKTDYFKEIATRVLSKNYENENKGWGLLSAALGNSSNLNSFVFNALNAKTPECDVHICHLDKKGKNIDGLVDYITKNRADFKIATNEFINAYNKVQNLLNKNLKKQKEALNNIYKARELQDKISKTELNNQSLQKQIDGLYLAIKEYELRKNHLKIPIQPSFFHTLFRTKVYKMYIQDKQNYDDEYQKYTDDIIGCTLESEKLKNKLNEESNKYSSLKLDLKKVEKDANDGCKYIYDNFLSDEIKKEKSSFFMSENGEKTELFEARVELFLKALNLHKAAILSNSEKFVSNLKKLREIFKKESTSKLDSVDMLNLWQTLFFVVPTISSTYASFATCFKDIGQNELGILLSDESGQAAITNAIGALYRVKNAVVVGDPLQLEPVVTLTNDINNKLLELFGVENEFNIKTTSMQIRADKTEKYGTYINQSGSKIWLGSPLRVHNRCDNPMFSVANKIAYDGIMIWGKDKNKGLGLKSTWIDIQDEEWEGNCNLAEIRALRELLDEYKDHHKDIGIISPFADNAKYIKDMVKDDYKNISLGKVGTIHTMQGKEAKVIILILGGSSDSARVWAASKPNLLNVALTRAKEYIYIIGNKEKYLKLPYFEDLADI